MKKYIIQTALLAFASTSMAQETYESAQIATQDLNGTARYVAMGGAMEALGADISTINTNPAGIGMFRRSWIGTSFGLNTQPSDSKTGASGKTTGSFDQIGFVYSSKIDKKNFINFAFNYSKSRNFNQILAAAGTLGKGSQNKLTYAKGTKDSEANGGFHIKKDGDEYIGAENANSQYTAGTFSQTDYILLNSINANDYVVTDGNGNPILDSKGNKQYETHFEYFDADCYAFNRDHRGYIGNYDMNVSGNYADRIYWGVTLGYKDVHYNATSIYSESLKDNNTPIGVATMIDDRVITGGGFDVKAGVIVRPIEGSPFRFGLSVTTPTWYELTSSNYTNLINESQKGNYLEAQSHESYKYKMFTPWKFGASLGHTIDNSLALGVSYEYADYAGISNRYITNEWYDDYSGSHDSDSEPDRAMNSHTKKTLQGVSTIKAGAEYKIFPELAVRIGYNYVSPMYKSSGSRDGSIISDGTYYASTTDYTNWKATNRVTAGFGYTKNGFSLDLAYQYSAQKGDFYPFQEISFTDKDSQVKTNSTACTEVTNNRHQVIMTLGYRF